MPKPRRVQVTPELVMPDRSDPDRHVDLSSLFAAPNVQALNIGRGSPRSPNPFQPRQEFTTQQLEELAEGMRTHGFLGTLLARPDPADEARYQLAYGERRLRAGKLAGLPTVPVIVRPLSDQEMLEIAIAENVLREDLNPIGGGRGLPADDDPVRLLGAQAGRAHRQDARLYPAPAAHPAGPGRGAGSWCASGPTRCAMWPR